jgi:glycosyltransferase involved in cell wall biosynthesis
VDLSGFRKILAKGIERLFISSPSLILVVSDSIADWYATNYKIVRPTVILNTPRRQSVEKNNYFRNLFRLKSQQKIFLYQGNLGLGRGIELLIKAFSDRNDDNAVLILMGYGDLEHLAVEMSNTSNIIFFHAAVPPAELLHYTAAADVGVALIENVCLSYFFCLPNKLFEYAMAGLPCIVSNGIEMQRVVEQAGLGLVIDPDDEDSISGAVEQMVLTDVSLYQRKARDMVNDFSWETQEQKLLTSLNKLCIK